MNEAFWEGTRAKGFRPRRHTMWGRFPPPATSEETNMFLHLFRYSRNTQASSHCHQHFPNKIMAITAMRWAFPQIFPVAGASMPSMSMPSMAFTEGSDSGQAVRQETCIAAVSSWPCLCFIMFHRTLLLYRALPILAPWMLCDMPAGLKIHDQPLNSLKELDRKLRQYQNWVQKSFHMLVLHSFVLHVLLWFVRFSLPLVCRTTLRSPEDLQEKNMYTDPTQLQVASRSCLPSDDSWAWFWNPSMSCKLLWNVLEVLSWHCTKDKTPA